MAIYNRIVEIEGKKVYVTRTMADYLGGENFYKLLEEYENMNKELEKINEGKPEEEKEKVEFYVGIYGNDLLERVGKERFLRDKISDDRRVKLIESLDFVDGSFIIDDFNKEKIERATADRIRQKEEEKESQKEEKIKKYSMGYASGAFTNFHPGHLEHLNYMLDDCEEIIIAVNSDDLIENYKNKTPSIDEEARADVLRRIRGVKEVIIAKNRHLDTVDMLRKEKGYDIDAVFVADDWKGSEYWSDTVIPGCKERDIDVVFTERPPLGEGPSTTIIDRENRKRNRKPIRYVKEKAFERKEELRKEKEEKLKKMNKKKKTGFTQGED